MQSGEGAVFHRSPLFSFSILHFAFCISLFTLPALADELTVDRHSLTVGESVTITVSLEDAFATLDDIDLPVKNLEVGASPSVSSEFSWINGTVVRRKVFRFVARAVAPGPALVGPLVLNAPDGQRETLAPIALQVLPDRAAGSNDPGIVLRELLATNRDPLFVIAEADRSSAYVGEEVVVTWWLYNAATVEQWQIGAIPNLADFWTEEIDVRSAQPVEVYVDGYAMQRVPIRRVALFPLRSGSLTVPPLEVEAALMRRTSGLFGVFEGNMAEISYSSAPLSLAVKPLPAAASGIAVGELSLMCGKPVQRNGGPVVMNVTLSGQGNVRAAAAPAFDGIIAADVQKIDRGVTVDKRAAVPSMTRRWEYLLFPSRGGPLSLPPLSMAVFSPVAGTTRTLQCAAATLMATTATPEPARTPSRSLPTRGDVARTGLIVAATAVALLIAFAAWRAFARTLRSRHDVHALVENRTPEQIRDAVHERMTAAGRDPAVMMREQSDCGDAYRALRSLLDATERERIAFDVREVKARIRDLLVCLQSKG